MKLDFRFLFSCLVASVFAVVLFTTLIDLTMLAYAQALPEVPSDPNFQYTFEQVAKLFKDWKLISYQAKIASVLVIVIGLVKNSALEGVFRGLGKWKAVVAPVLSLVAALFLVQPMTIATALAAITTGIAAGYIHQILDLLKTIPGLGAVYVGIIDFIGKILGRPDAQAIAHK